MIIYILTNECMPDIVKIGITDNLERRIRELDNTSTPLPYECFYAVEVEDDKAPQIERMLHRGLDDSRVRQNREFFYTSPDNAKSLLRVAEVMGGKDVTPNEDFVETPQDKQALENAKKIRKRFNFQMLDLQPGTKLYFKKDNTITCEVHDDTRVNFRNEIISLSEAASRVIKELGYDWAAVSGPHHWCIDGKSLYELRIEMDV